MNARHNQRMGILFAMPWILGFTVFLAYPLISSFYYSFTNFSILSSPRWIGGSNYSELMGDQVFHQSLKNTLLFAAASVPLATVFAILLALLLNSKTKGMAFYRTIFYIPSLVPMVALGVLWLWVFNGQYGLLNEGLRHIGLPPPPWLTEPAWAKWTLVIISVWGTGNAMVIYLAGLQDVPQSLYEAADIDGAKAWGKTRHVTIPMISPVILFNVIMGIIGSLQTFALPYVMFPGGQPARSTYFFSMYLYDTAFQYQRMGYASAMGWVMFAITLSLTLLALKLSSKHVHYEGG
ncbi:MAG: sugar ABC transporter permease [Fimbriimonas sp.]|nr:sugar ABC transporter permease [Fimbriimonas sp.]